MNRIVIIIVLLVFIYYLYEDSVLAKERRSRFTKVIKELKNEKDNLKEKITSLKKALRESKNNLKQTNNDLKQLNEDILKEDSLNIHKENKVYKNDRKNILDFDKNLKKETLEAEEDTIKIKPDINYDKETKEITLDGLKIELKQKF